MYAKDYYSNTKLVSDPGLCFVLMPFSPRFDLVWETIRNTVSGQPFNLLCRRPYDISQPGHIMTDVLENIGRARLLIADLTGQNPNVFYELGIAHGFKDASQVILIASDIEEIPFDLRHLRSIIYGTEHDTLRELLTRTLTEIGVKQYGLILGEGESGKMPARLTGDDQCLYDLEIEVQYLGDDGVKFRLRVVRYEVGKGPVETLNNGYYLGVDEPAMSVPGIPWSLCYHRPNTDHARFILGRPPGWNPVNTT